ncbi:MAG: AmmeMemoRadiSam system radical SAM enzyme [Candidatus Nanoarchaeia archaeon]
MLKSSDKIEKIFESKKECYCYEKLEESKVKCLVCAHKCLISDGLSGICEVRENVSGKLYSKVYNKIVAQHIDPIEKKPLYHFLPGSKTLSVGTVGCNFNCVFCQNHSISFPGEKLKLSGEPMSPRDIVDLAIKNGCQSIAYTYTEPTIFLELVIDTSKIAKQKGLKNILVTNGYMTKDALDLLSETIDAVNIDLKGFSESFYMKNCKAKLEPVLETIKELNKTNMWLEITTLLIEGENDSELELRNLTKFIARIDREIPWHISRFFPMHKMQNIPSTNMASLKRAQEIGQEEGLKHIYLGNIGSEQNTLCSSCNKTLISRDIYEVKVIGLTKNQCINCKIKLKGVFK